MVHTSSIPAVPSSSCSPSDTCRNPVRDSLCMFHRANVFHGEDRPDSSTFIVVLVLDED